MRLRPRLACPRTAASVIALAATFAAAPAFAQNAAAVFQEALKAAERGDAGAACRLFQASYALEASDGTALNIGGCRETDGDFVGAYNMFAEVSVRAEKVGRKDRVELATQRMKALEPKVALVAVRLGAMTHERTTTLDKKLMPLLMVRPVAVPAGPHLVEVQGKNGPIASRTLTAVVGETVLLDAGVPLTTEAPTTVEQPATRVAPGHARDSSSRKTVGFVVAGVGLVSLGACAVTGIMALGKKSDADAAQKQFDRAAFDASTNDGKSLATLSTVTGIVGAVATGVGVYLVVTSPTSSTVGSVRLVPLAGRVNGASLSATF